MNRSIVLKKVAQWVIIVVAAAAVISVSFFCGYYYGKGNSSSSESSAEADSYEWILSIIENYYYQDVSTENFYEYAIDSFISEYLDSYSAYYTAEEYQALIDSNSGNKTGYGISYTYLPTQGILVSSVVFNSPAYKSGIRSGDVIVSATCGGKTTEFSSSSEFSTYTSSMEDGEEVYFNTAEESFVVAKSSYTASYVVCATNESSWAFLSDGSGTPALTETGTDAIDNLPDGAGYICLSQFYGDAASEFAQAVAVLNENNCSSIILDLRSNGGGYVSVMQYIASCFTLSQTSSSVCAMTAKYKSGTESSVYTDSKYASADGCYVSGDTQVYVLANGGTASASEALIGVLISYGIIDYGDIYLSDYSSTYLSLVGGTAESTKSCRTYGKGIMQTTYTNSSTGEAVKLTTAQIYWPDGTTIHGTGITAADGALTVESPYPCNGAGEELSNAINLIYG